MIAKPYRSRLGHSCAGVVGIVAATAAFSPPARVPHSDPYRALPTAIRTIVAQRGCRPPRRSDADAFAVARGFFFASPHSGAPNDWAVLCVRDDSAEILVFRDKKAAPELLPQWARPSRTPDDSGDAPVCEGAIARLTPPLLASIVRNGTLADGGSLTAAERHAPPHDGIVDGDCEGVAVIHYWTGSRWVILPGSD